jgi:uncharacterized protein YndB with AHSA1/START domain
MNDKLKMEFSINKENNTINIKREFAADVSLVWDAYTKSEILALWWAPKPWKAKTKSMDFREGGRWLYAMCGPEGEEHWSFLDYLKIQRSKGFTAVDGFSDKEGNINTEMPQSNWEVKFTSQANHCLVSSQITYSTLEQIDTIIQMGFKEGITMAMEGLDEYLLTKGSK